VSDAGSGNTILRLNRRMVLLLLDKVFETVSFGSLIFNSALKQTQRLIKLKAF
jgi:hypothetical protein